MKLRITALALILALMSVFVVAPKSAGAAPAQATAGVTIPLNLTGTFANGQAGTFAGNLNITGFTSQGGVLSAVGTITGTVTNTVTGVTQDVTQAVTIPLQATGTCTILTLDTGAIHLNLLGLVVDLAPIHLSVTAQAGPGNLLGNLLCSVAHLLDNPGNPLGGIAALLNHLLNLGAITPTL